HRISDSSSSVKESDFIGLCSISGEGSGIIVSSGMLVSSLCESIGRGISL
ncbi:14226_t:CDS:1, partial [Acaulospora morrowiae]